MECVLWRSRRREHRRRRSRSRSSTGQHSARAHRSPSVTNCEPPTASWSTPGCSSYAYGCSTVTVVLIGVTCPAMTVATVSLTRSVVHIGALGLLDSTSPISQPTRRSVVSPSLPSLPQISTANQVPMHSPNPQPRYSRLSNVRWVVFYGWFWVIEAHGGPWFTTPVS